MYTQCESTRSTSMENVESSSSSFSVCMRWRYLASGRQCISNVTVSDCTLCKTVVSIYKHINVVASFGSCACTHERSCSGIFTPPVPKSLVRRFLPEIEILHQSSNPTLLSWNGLARHQFHLLYTHAPNPVKHSCFGRCCWH